MWISATLFVEHHQSRAGEYPGLAERLEGTNEAGGVAADPAEFQAIRIFGKSTGGSAGQLAASGQHRGWGEAGGGIDGRTVPNYAQGRPRACRAGQSLRPTPCLYSVDLNDHCLDQHLDGFDIDLGNGAIDHSSAFPHSPER